MYRLTSGVISEEGRSRRIYLSFYLVNTGSKTAKRIWSPTKQAILKAISSAALGNPTCHMTSLTSIYDKNRRSPTNHGSSMVCGLD